jgi:ketosteroid isomerase-like protein
VDHPNVDIVERAWLAVAEADVESLEDLWSPDIVWHVTAQNPWTGDHVGRDAVLDYLADVGEAGEAYEANIEDVLASDDRALIVSRVKARRGDREIDTAQCMLARIEDERIVEVWTLPLDPAAFAGFWRADTGRGPQRGSDSSPGEGSGSGSSRKAG